MPLLKTLSSWMLLSALLCCTVVEAMADEIKVKIGDLERQNTHGWIATGLKLPAANQSFPVIAESADDPASRLLKSLATRGVVNGFRGMIYDNRDRGHSALPRQLFPTLTHLKYSLGLRLTNADVSLAGAIQYPAIVFGNSSMAVTGGTNARSLTRLAMTSRDTAATSARLYLNNHMYIYPEHRDYDEIDHYPANWPYHIVSQGSSGSDQPFLRAIGATLAAFPEDTLDNIKDRRLVAPTLQMIMRRNLKQVSRPEDFFSGSAQRPVLRGEDLRPDKMVHHAASLRPEDVLPLPEIEVIEETFSEFAGLAQLDETLFDTPSAVARIWRNFAGTNEMLISASASENPHGLQISYSWHLLQGDPEKVVIEPMNDDGAVARLAIEWHDPFDLPIFEEDGTLQRVTSRVDIGVFATSAHGSSPAAIVSIAFPKHQRRTYFRNAKNVLRIENIDYHAKGRSEYFDPILYWSAPWVDTAEYDDAGVLLGWQREFFDDSRKNLTVSAITLLGSYNLTESGNGRVLEYSE